MRKTIPILMAFAFSIATLFSSAASSQVIQGKTLGEERNGSWSSYGLALSDSFNYRASTFGSDGTTLLAIDMVPGTCVGLLSMIFPYTSPLERDIPALKVLIDARIDSGEVLYLSGKFSGTMGDKFGIIWVDVTSKYFEILRMMRAGSILRVKIQHANGEYIDTVSFSLSGFTYSSNRIKKICEKAGTQSTPAPQRSEHPDPKMGDALLRQL